MIQYIALGIGIINLILITMLLIRGNSPYQSDKKEQEQTRMELKSDIRNLENQIQFMIDNNDKHNKSIAEIQNERLNDFRNSVESLDRKLSEKFDRLQQTQTESIKGMMEDNQKQLDKIRGTVDEKLSETIKSKFEESFTMISNQLEKVSQSLNEINNLAKDVGTLNKVLAAPKTRGNWGEMQLEGILTNVFSEEQFLRDVSIDGSRDNVEFAIRIPDKENEILLPIDSKFPLDKYIDVIDASETYDKEKIQKAEKELIKAIKDQSKKITKYIVPPKTMDMAIMYLPTEGLYAEVAKQPDLLESVYRDYRVCICGPNTLNAMLNSLAIGMRQVAINKRSVEIAKLLQSFKREFTLFSDLIVKIEKKIDEASSTISDTKKKTQTIQKQLSGIADITIEDKKYIENNED